MIKLLRRLLEQKTRKQITFKVDNREGRELACGMPVLFFIIPYSLDSVLNWDWHSIRLME